MRPTIVPSDTDINRLAPGYYAFPELLEKEFFDVPRLMQVRGPAQRVFRIEENSGPLVMYGDDIEVRIRPDGKRVLMTWYILDDEVAYRSAIPRS